MARRCAVWHGMNTSCRQGALLALLVLAGLFLLVPELRRPPMVTRGVRGSGAHPDRGCAPLPQSAGSHGNHGNDTAPPPPPPPPSPLRVTDLKYLINAPSLCQPIPNQPLLLFFVHSAWSHAEQRRLIRTTWGGVSECHGYGVRHVFVLASTPDPRGTRDVAEESRRHGDVIVGDFLDDYRNLTLKHLLAYRWVGEHCSHAHYVIKVDDDTFVNLFRLADFLRRRRPQAQTQRHQAEEWKSAAGVRPRSALRAPPGGAVGVPAEGATGVRPETMGVRPETMGVRPETMGVRPEAMGVHPETMGVRPEGGAMEVHPGILGEVSHPEGWPEGPPRPPPRPPPDTPLLYCSVYTNQGPRRDKADKWYVTRDEYPGDRYPDYCEGFAYVTTPGTIERLYRATAELAGGYYWIDDVFVTGVLASRAGVRHTPFRDPHGYGLLPRALRGHENAADRVLFLLAKYYRDSHVWGALWNATLQREGRPHPAGPETITSSVAT